MKKTLMKITVHGNNDDFQNFDFYISPYDKSGFSKINENEISLTAGTYNFIIEQSDLSEKEYYAFRECILDNVRLSDSRFSPEIKQFYLNKIIGTIKITEDTYFNVNFVPLVSHVDINSEELLPSFDCSIDTNAEYTITNIEYRKEYFSKRKLKFCNLRNKMGLLFIILPLLTFVIYGFIKLIISYFS